MPGHVNVEAHGEGNAGGLVEMIDTYDRKGKVFANKGRYTSKTKKVVGFTNKPGKRIPKAELSAVAGIGHAHAEWHIFEAEARGPNACAGVKASVLGAEAFANAELGSASASAGPFKVKLSLAVKTGVAIGIAFVEVKLLGTGFSFGRKIGVSVLGSEFSFNLW